MAGDARAVRPQARQRSLIDHFGALAHVNILALLTYPWVCSERVTRCTPFPAWLSGCRGWSINGVGTACDPRGYGEGAGDRTQGRDRGCPSGRRRDRGGVPAAEERGAPVWDLRASQRPSMTTARADAGGGHSTLLVPGCSLKPTHPGWRAGTMVWSSPRSHGPSRHWSHSGV